MMKSFFACTFVCFLLGTGIATAAEPPASLLAVGPFGQPLNWVAGNCDSFHDTAIWAGWSEAEWPRVRKLMRRESNCHPEAYNWNRRTRDNSYGMLQLNDWGGILWRPMRSGFGSMASECGLLHDDALFDPAVNLLCAKKLHDAWGWRPWT
jgi:hypothetical protein